MGSLNIIVCFSMLASMISPGYECFYDDPLGTSPLPGYHYETFDTITNNREPGSYQIMTVGEALLTGNLNLRGFSGFGFGGNNAVDEETSTRQSGTGDSNYLDRFNAVAPYAPIILKVAELFVPGLGQFQQALMVYNVASIAAKAVQGYAKGDTMAKIGQDVGPDIYRAVLAKRGYVDSIKEAVVPRLTSVKNWIMGSTADEEVSDKQIAVGEVSDKQIAIEEMSDKQMAIDQPYGDMNYQTEEKITMVDNSARLNAMSGEEFLERITKISDQFPKLKYLDIKGSFQSLLENKKFPELPSKRKEEMANALDLTTRFFIAQFMQPGIANLI